MKRQSLKSITSFLLENQFHNWRNWNHKELTQYVVANFQCGKQLAEKVAYEIQNW